ncbi:MAG: phosphate acyltransferase PlsX [Enterovibrio sp.]
MTSLSIAVDAMGGDFGPQVTVPACVRALSFYPSLKIILTGDEAQIQAQLALLASFDPARLTILHTPHTIANSTAPSKALHASAGTSMRVAIEQVAQHAAAACVSGGNTGALMALSRFLLKLLPGIDKPALISNIPTHDNGVSWLLDLGANVTASGEVLLQFATMGAAAAELQLGRPAKVALLNMGEEAIKGSEAVKTCALLLKQSTQIEYIGYLEGDSLYSGKADVIVCEGFVGNTCLKTSEGVARLFLSHLKRDLAGSIFKRVLAKWLFAGLFKRLNTLDPDQYNGASLLGLQGIVVKSHGSADENAFFNAIGQAIHEAERNLPKKICDRLDAVLRERLD